MSTDKYPLNIKGSLTDYRNGECLPKVIMAMSIALATNVKGYCFTDIEFGAMNEDEDGYFSPFIAKIKDVDQGALLVCGAVRLNLMEEFPAGKDVVFFKD